MKKVLSLLVSFVFLQTQSWALSGGPVYGGDVSSLSGTYGGVMVPELDSTTIDPNSTTFGTNSLGVFSIGVPTTNFAQGAIVLFFEGAFFQGGIQGIADPGSNKLFGVALMLRLNGKQVDTTGGEPNVSLSADGRADGTVQADIDTKDFRISGEAVFALRLTAPDGTETSGGTLRFSIDGFRQSSEVTLPTAGSTAALLNT